MFKERYRICLNEETETVGEDSDQGESGRPADNCSRLTICSPTVLASASLLQSCC